MEIRLAGVGDLEGMARAHRASVAGLCAGYYPAEAIRAWVEVLAPAIYEEALREKHTVVAVEDGRIAGLGILDIARGQVSTVYVEPGFAGKGVGGRILEVLEQTAADKGLRQLELLSTLNAVGFYRRHGYTQGRQTAHGLPNGMQLACVEMTKTLDRSPSTLG